MIETIIEQENTIQTKFGLAFDWSLKTMSQEELDQVSVAEISKLIDELILSEEVSAERKVAILRCLVDIANCASSID